MVLTLTGTVIRKEFVLPKVRVSEESNEASCVEMQKTKPPSLPVYDFPLGLSNDELEKLDDRGLVKLFQQSNRNDADKIFNILLTRYEKFIEIKSLAFHRTYRKLSADDFKSEGIIAFYNLLNKISVEKVEKIEHYIKTAISNSLRNYVRSNRNHISTTSINNDNYEKPLSGIIQEGAPETDSKLDLLNEFLENEDLASLINNKKNNLPASVIELTYGIDLGTNPTHEILKEKEIRRRLERGKISIYTNKKTAIEKLRILLRNKENAD